MVTMTLEHRRVLQCQHVIHSSDVTCKCATLNNCLHLAIDWNLPTAVTNAKLINCTIIAVQ